MTLADKSHGYVTPVGRVRYGDDLFEPPSAQGPPEGYADRVKPEFVERFHAIVEELTDELMAGGHFDRATCRLDAITLLVAASDRLQKDQAGESPLHYLLMEERQKATAATGARGAPALTFMKA